MRSTESGYGIDMVRNTTLLVALVGLFVTTSVVAGPAVASTVTVSGKTKFEASSGLTITFDAGSSTSLNMDSAFSGSDTIVIDTGSKKVTFTASGDADATIATGDLEGTTKVTSLSVSGVTLTVDPADKPKVKIKGAFSSFSYSQPSSSKRDVTYDASSSSTLTVHGLDANTDYELVDSGGTQLDTATTDGSGVATFSAPSGSYSGAKVRPSGGGGGGGGGSSTSGTTVDITADIDANTTARPFESITFDGSGSSGDNEITDYQWDFDGDGAYDATGKTVTEDFRRTGTHDVTLKVSDDFDNSDTETITVNVTARETNVTTAATTTQAPNVTTVATPTTTTAVTPTETEPASPRTTTGAETPEPSPTEAITTPPTERTTRTPTVTSSPVVGTTTRTTATPTTTATGPGFGVSVTLVAVALLLLIRRRT